MTVRERILLIRLLEKKEKQPEYAARLGIQTGFSVQSHEKKEVTYV